MCAALISREPVSRDDACLYTPDASAMVTEKDRKVLEALATDVLPQDRDRLLTDGRGEPTPSSALEAARGAAKSGFQAATTSTKKLTDAVSVAISVSYGYPGALPPDASPLPARSEADGPKPARKNVSVTVPGAGGDDILAAEANKPIRRSGGKVPFVK